MSHRNGYFHIQRAHKNPTKKFHPDQLFSGFFFSVASTATSNRNHVVSAIRWLKPFGSQWNRNRNEFMMANSRSMEWCVREYAYPLRKTTRIAFGCWWWYTMAVGSLSRLTPTLTHTHKKTIWIYRKSANALHFALGTFNASTNSVSCSIRRRSKKHNSSLTFDSGFPFSKAPSGQWPYLTEHKSHDHDDNCNFCFLFAERDREKEIIFN